MFAIGLVVGLALFIATGFWYRQPNSRFSSRILGRDVDEPQGTVQFLRGAAQETVRVLRASRTPSLDAVVERVAQVAGEHLARPGVRKRSGFERRDLVEGGTSVQA